MRRITWALVITLMLSQAVYAACTGSSPTWTSTIDLASVQSCVNNASNGDTINVASGTATWSGEISWTNKNIAIIGAGIGNTTITRNGTAFRITMTNATQSWRVSGFTFTGTSLNQLFYLNSGNTNNPTKGWRIDHLRTNYSSGAHEFFIQGISWGVIDHVTVDGSPHEISKLYGYMNSSAHEGPGCSPHCFGYWYWNRNLNLGSDEAVYFEDFTVNFNGGGTPAFFDLVYGGSAVLRHSNINGDYFITHSPRDDDRGGMKYEVYNNTFNGNGFFRFANLRSGTGVIFNNTVSGYQLNEINIDDQRANTPCLASSSDLGVCNGSNPVDGNIEASGWPCVDSCGRGAVLNAGENGELQSNTPVYGWKNGTTSTCATGGTCNNSVLITINGACLPQGTTYWRTTGNAHTNGQVDYVNNGNTPKPGYTALTYPHPLVGGGEPADTTPPATPSGLFISKQ